MPASSTSRVAERVEARILLRACGSTGAGAPIASAESPARTAPDWEWLLRAAERHAVVPALHHHLASGAEGEVPPHILDWLRARSDENALRNVLLARQLADVLERLDAAGVAAIPLKGPALAVRAYGGVAPRQFYDLDVLVRRADVTRARAALEQAGFTAMTPLDSTGAAAALLAADYQQAYDGASCDAPLALELHWGLARDGALRWAWAWDHARPERLLGRDVWTLSPGAELLYLAVHGAKHGWRQLGWMRDVAQLRRTAPDADAAACDLARAARAERTLALALLLSTELAGAPAVPGAIGDAVRALADEVRARLFDELAPQLGDAVRFQLRVRERWLDRAAYVMDLSTSPHLADVSAVSLPPALGALYRVVRPVRLIARRMVAPAPGHPGARSPRRKPGRGPQHGFRRSPE